MMTDADIRYTRLFDVSSWFAMAECLIDA